MPSLFNNRLRQVILLGVIILLALLLLKQLYIFLPGFLGAITLYILLREWYFYLVIKRKWNSTLVSLSFIIISIVVIAIPIYFAIELLGQKLAAILTDPVTLMSDARIVGAKIKDMTGFDLVSDENIRKMQINAASIVPKLLNSSASLLSNFAIMFFLLYFLFKSGRSAEKFLGTFIPLKNENVEILARETKNMVKANAIGIPVLAILQGTIAVIGYWIFGVQDFVLWGFLTGIFSLVPVVGTAIIWIPICLYMYSTGNSNAIWLLLYSVLLITNIDYVARLTILKRFMNVHPLVTIFGVIVGVGLFGFWGVIFGPLLISYFVILVKIYVNEFGEKVPTEENKDEQNVPLAQ